MNILIADDSKIIRETLSQISVDASGEMLGGKRRRERLRVLFYPSIQYSSNRRNGTENEILTPAYQTPVKKLKIIIAEDDESSSMLISIVVRKFTKEIIKVQTGTKAV